MSCLEVSRNTPKTEENEEKSAVDNMGLSSLLGLISFLIGPNVCMLNAEKVLRFGWLVLIHDFCGCDMKENRFIL